MDNPMPIIEQQNGEYFSLLIPELMFQVICRIPGAGKRFSTKQLFAVITLAEFQRCLKQCEFNRSQT